MQKTVTPVFTKEQILHLTEILEKRGICNVDIMTLPKFLGETLLDRIHKLIEYKEHGIEFYDHTLDNKIKNNKQMTPAEHKQYMENILNRLSEELLVKQPPKKEAPKLPVKLIEEVLSDYLMNDIFVSPLQSWLNTGKVLVESEIIEAEENIEVLRDTVNYIQKTIKELQETLTSSKKELENEITRINNLHYLLKTINY